jgi:hypothetical protein
VGRLHSLVGSPRVSEATSSRPWGRALVWIAILGPFFFASYGFANWLASTRPHVGSVVFAWERSIPFLPWTIVPYWSIDLLYGLSLLVATSRSELEGHAHRLLAVQLISVACFIAFPLRFSFERPAAEGVFGALFTALGSFDKPFNQAPSLHVALLVVIWTRLAAHCPGRWRWALHGWMTLIGVSVLTTFQHHFVDLPTGLAVGFAAQWALPDQAPSPLSGLELPRDPGRRRLAGIYALGALAFVAAALAGGAWLWLAWPALSLGLVSLIYLAVGPRGFQKAEDGRLSVGAWGLLAPYILGAFVNSRLWTLRYSRASKVADGVSIGRFQSPGELARAGFAAVVDVAPELPGRAHPGLVYRVVSMLDLTVPDATTLREAAEAVEQARRHGAVLVCCALGFSRSALVVAAWLVTTGRVATVEEAIRAVQKARPAVVLGGRHRTVLQALA